jgi:hypothetical protein
MQVTWLHTEGRQRWSAVAAITLLALLAVFTWWRFLTQLVWPVATEQPWHNPGYWVAARVAYEGQGDIIYGRSRELAEASRRLGTVFDPFDANMPTTLLPFLPLAGLPIDQALVRWELVSLGSFVAAWLLMLWAARIPVGLALGLSALVVFNEPIRRNLFMGQVYSLVLLGTVAGAVLAARAYDSTEAEGQARDRWLWIGSGLAYALVCVVKLFYGAVELLAPVAKKQWKIVGTAVVAYGAAALLTLLWVSPGKWLEALGLSAAWRDRPDTAVTAYQTINGFITHLLRYDQDLNPGPVADVPWLVGPLWFVVALCVVGVSSVAVVQFQAKRRDEASRLLPYALAVPVALLLTPVAADYHFTLALFPALVTLGAMWHGRTRQPIAWAILAVSLLLLSWPWQYYNVPGTEGWRALLYYPRLYGTLLVWGLMLWCIWRRGELPDRVLGLQAVEANLIG